MPNVVDSSGWLSYVLDAKHAGKFAEPIYDLQNLIVPSIVILEVAKKITNDKSEDIALNVVAHMQSGTVVDLETDIALLASQYSTELNLPMADSIIYATGQKYNATIWTQDSDFKGLADVKYFAV